MRTRRESYRNVATMCSCELTHCPQCGGELRPADYVNGRKTIQTLHQVMAIAYRPKACTASACPTAGQAWPSAGWKALAPKYGTYGYDVIAEIGWERQWRQAHIPLRGLRPAKCAGLRSGRGRKLAWSSR